MGYALSSLAGLAGEDVSVPRFSAAHEDGLYAGNNHVLKYVRKPDATGYWLAEPGALALKSAVWETMITQCPLRLAIR